MSVELAREADGGWVARAAMPEAGPWALALGRGLTPEVAEDAALEELAASVSRGEVSSSVLRPRKPGQGETLGAYLDWHGLLNTGFVLAELVRPGPRHVSPPRERWPAIVPTLAAALLLRSWLVDAGGRGLVVAAAYRPRGGAAKSRHKTFAALDLDLLEDDHRLAGSYLRLAAKLYRTHGSRLQLGVGSYHPPGTLGTRRIHVDAGTRAHPACWQINGGEYVAEPAIAEIARESTP